MKTFFVLFISFLFSGLLIAQDPAKDIRKASTYLGSYHMDPVNSASKLDLAIDLANSAMRDAAVKADPAAWLTYGEVFMAAVNKDVTNLVLNSEAPISHPEAPKKAFEGFKMSAQLATKSYHTTDAMKKLSEGIQNLYYLGSVLYQRKDYAHAYDAFLATYDAYTLLKEKNQETTFLAEDYPKSLYASALCAESAGMENEARMALERLVQTGTDEPSVYITLFNMYSKTDPSKAEKLLSDARQKFPDNKDVLFAEINYRLSKGETENLVAQLNDALRLDPGNASIYVTLGQIYDTQFQGAQSSVKTLYDSIAVDKQRYNETKKSMFQDSVKALEAQLQPATALIIAPFDKAQNYYLQALGKDSTNFDALYSLGALWYNLAAGYTVELNYLSDDYSSAGTRKWELKKAQMDETFNKALPYFLKAEAINPRDYNTLIALKEIYARQDKLDLATEYKAKVEQLNKQ